MTHDELVEAVRGGLRLVLADIEPGTRVHELCDAEVEDLARAAIRVIAPAVLKEAISTAVWDYADTTAEKLRALKTRYEQ